MQNAKIYRATISRTWRTWHLDTIAMVLMRMRFSVHQMYYHAK